MARTNQEYLNTYKQLLLNYLTAYDTDEAGLDRISAKMFRTMYREIPAHEGGVSLLSVFLHARKYVAESEKDNYLRLFLSNPFAYRSISELTEDYLRQRRKPVCDYDGARASQALCY